MVTVDMLHFNPIPKRGDLLQTNVGNRRERTFLVLHSRRLPDREFPRAKIWAERWWDMEPELRMSLFRSAERNGGQRVIYFTRYIEKRRVANGTL